MNVTVRIPNELAERLAAEGGDLERRALEGFAVAEYQAGRLTALELRQLLDIPTRYDLDGFLKARGVFEDYTLEDLERERQTLERLGF
jgi:predicted HTH domain antitoxin